MVQIGSECGSWKLQTRSASNAAVFQACPAQCRALNNFWLIDWLIDWVTPEKYAGSVKQRPKYYAPYAPCTLHCIVYYRYYNYLQWMGLVPFRQPSTLFCCCHLVLHIFCCIVEDKPSLSILLAVTGGGSVGKCGRLSQPRCTAPGRTIIVIYVLIYLLTCVAQWAQRRSLAGELTLCCARPVADGWPLCG